MRFPTAFGKNDFDLQLHTPVPFLPFRLVRPAGFQLRVGPVELIKD
jgi:hypothetical protein